VSQDLILQFNGDTGANYTTRRLEGNGTGAASDTATSGALYGSFMPMSAASATANTFGNGEAYIPNYTGSALKSFSTDSVAETNATATKMSMCAALWNSTAAITSILIRSYAGNNLVQYSTFYLYGVAKLGTTPVIVPYATGGDTIMTDGTYWYHTFISSGTFTPAKGLSCTYLVVGAGGGGSGGTSGVTYGSGGAGGISQTGTVSISSAQTVTIGAGGAGSTSQPNSGSNGSSCSIGSLVTATAGTGGGPLRTGGSNADFTAIAYQVGDSAGGGAGAGAANSNQNGGAGVASSITGTSVGRGGGGAGSASGGALGTATDGGSSGVNATANLGGGGSGGDASGRNGGSGIVIIRYA
jgi:hypothetical protein